MSIVQFGYIKLCCQGVLVVKDDTKPKQTNEQNHKKVPQTLTTLSLVLDKVIRHYPSSTIETCELLCNDTIMLLYAVESSRWNYSMIFF